jgi:hypothetical protein
MQSTKIPDLALPPVVLELSAVVQPPVVRGERRERERRGESG